MCRRYPAVGVRPLFEPAQLPGSRETPVATKAEPRQRLAGLDGPRGMSCLGVITLHVAVFFTPAFLAATHVDFVGQLLTLFFVLSCFLLYLPYVKRLSEGGSMPDTLTYFRHRIFRIFPAYLVIFLIANFALRAVYVENPLKAGWGHTDHGTGMMTDPISLLANLTLTHSLFPATFQTGISPSWSLTTEWGFYLFLPLIGIALFAWARKRAEPWKAAVWPPLILCVVGITTNTTVAVLQAKYYPHAILEAYWGPNWIAVLSRSFLGISDNFAFGMLAAVIFVALARGKWKSMTTFRLQLIFATVAGFALVCSMVLFVLNPRYVATAFALASGAFIVLIVAPIARGEHSTIASVTDWRPLRYLGTISLSAYLWHFPVLVILTRLKPPIPDNLWGFLIALVIVTGATVACASLTYRFVELPAMKRRG
jgi:peptidoglycan/LPS O-acetylase OafA/YrhL